MLSLSRMHVHVWACNGKRTEEQPSILPPPLFRYPTTEEKFFSSRGEARHPLSCDTNNFRCARTSYPLLFVLRVHARIRGSRRKFLPSLSSLLYILSLLLFPFIPITCNAHSCLLLIVRMRECTREQTQVWDRILASRLLVCLLFSLFPFISHILPLSLSHIRVSHHRKREERKERRE